MTQAMQEALRIVVIISDPTLVAEGDEQARAIEARSRLLRIGLLEAGYNLVATLPADVFLTERLAQLQADMVIVDAESDARDALEHVVMATRDERRPIVMFTNDSDIRPMNEAVAAGVTAYIVAGLAPERIHPILTVAMARFKHEQALLAELDNARGELQDRKLIDRAKGLLMQRQGLSEPEAYARLRKAAMNKGVKLADIAQQMIDMVELLG
jgi:response regulator NasT